MRRILSLSVWLLACQPVAPTTNAVASQGPNTVLATVGRAEVWGGSPWYRATVFNSGNVTWEGSSAMDSIPRTPMLSAAQLAQVRQAFEDAGYFELGGDFACRGLSDLAVVTTSYSDGVRSQSIRHDRGCRRPDGVATLNKLELRLEEILGVPESLGGY
ncbi:MAG: hypothetical protein QM723_28215 [Myxococcaceae bacterium]